MKRTLSILLILTFLISTFSSVALAAVESGVLPSPTSEQNNIIVNDTDSLQDGALLTDETNADASADLQVSNAPLGGIGGKITEKVTEVTKRALSKHLTLYLEEVSKGYDAADKQDTSLNLLYSATDMTINEILKVTQETLALVEEVDDEIDALTDDVADLKKQIEKGFAEDKYEKSAILLDSVALRLQPLWKKYEKLLVRANDETYTTAQRQADILAFMKEMDAVYGANGTDSISKDLDTLNLALYSVSGRATFLDAQEELSRLNHPFEHQITEEVKAAYSYGASLQIVLIGMFEEYASFCLTNPDLIDNSKATEIFVAQGNRSVTQLNTQAEYINIDAFFSADDVNDVLILEDGTEIEVYHVRSSDKSAGSPEYMIAKEPMTVSDTFTRTRKIVQGSAHVASYEEIRYTPKHLGKMASHNSQWYVPRNEAELKTLFDPSTTTDPLVWLEKQGLTDIKAADAFMLNDVYSYFKDYGYESKKVHTYTQGYVDAHSISHDKNTLTWDCYLNMDGFYNGNKTSLATKYKYTSRSSEIPVNETIALTVFLDRSKNMNGVEKDPDTGFYTPINPSALPSEMYLTDGEVLDLSKLKSTDLLEKTIYTSGKVRIIGNGSQLENLEIKLSRESIVTVENLIIKQQDNKKNVITVLQPNAQLHVVGECSFTGKTGLYLEEYATNFVIAGQGTATSRITISGGDKGVESHAAYTRSLHLQNVTANITGTSYGVCKLDYLSSNGSDLTMSGGTYDVDVNSTSHKGSNVINAHDKYHIDIAQVDPDSTFQNGRWILALKTLNKSTASTGNDVFMSFDYNVTLADGTKTTLNSKDMEISKPLTDGGHFKDNAKYEKILNYETSQHANKVDSVIIHKTGSDGFGLDTITLKDTTYSDRGVYDFSFGYNIDDHGNHRGKPITYQSATSEKTIYHYTEEDVLAFIEAYGDDILHVPFYQNPNFRMTDNLLKTLKEKGNSLQMTVVDGEGMLYGWGITAENLKNVNEDFPLNVNIGTAAQMNLTHIVKDGSAIVLDFDHDGPLPGLLDIRVNAGRFGLNSNDTLELLRIEDGKAVSLKKDIKVQDIKQADVQLDRCSTYVLRKQASVSPAKTGDTTPIDAWLTLALTSGMILLVAAVYRKRENSHR